MIDIHFPRHFRDVPSNLSEEQVKKSLRNSILDGSAYSAMVGLTQNYITPFALTIKATTQQIGLLASVPNFTMAAAQLAAPGLSERVGSRKSFILRMVLMHALMWLPILLIPYLFTTHQVWWLIGLVTLSTAFDAAASPVWGSMMADLVPAEIRGRFFGRRNRIGGVVSLAFTYVAGGILQLLTGNTNLAFAVIFAGAMASRLVSLYFLSQMYEPLSPATEKQNNESMLKIAGDLFSTNIGMFMLFCALINLTTNIAGPFFSPYMLRDLRFSYMAYAVMSSAAALAAIGFITWWGKRMDRAGSIKVLKISGLLVPFVALGWALSSNFWWLIAMQIFSGFAWSGFQLSSSVFIFDASPPQNRTRYIALYNSLVYLGLSVGPLVGGIVAPYLPLFMGSYFRSIFIVSGVARLAVALFFLPRVKEVRRVPEVKAEELLLGNLQPARLKQAFSSMVEHLRRRKTH
ncbi:MAG: MFS transporter [Chloroflexi bacterium]|nr:MFS transporter [Chloroflexota bacterium]NWF78197.1 MFS transporter [Chloroflexota bacterium]